MAKSSVKIRKFNTIQILFHWFYGGAWILLVLTGVIFLWRPDPAAGPVGLGPMLMGSVGQWARFMHRVAAVIFMVAPLIWLFSEPKRALGELKELLRMGPDDWKYLVRAPLHYTTGKPELPPQGKYNGGHKMNFWIVLVTFVTFTLSGLVMWFMRGAVSAEVFNWMLLLHSISFWVGLAMGLAHIYLTLIHPFTRQAFGSMVDGYVPMGYAKAEHILWVEDQIKSGKAELREEPNKA